MDTILIVDDDQGILLLIKTILGEVGFRLLTAADGLSARKLLERGEEKLAAILLDWEMPEMTGIELLRWIKEQPELENTPVIMQTAMDSPQQIKEGIDAGAFYYLTKPFDQKLLLSIVRAAVSDYCYKESLLKKVKESENPFELLAEGTFHFRSLAEGEYLAVRIANACPSPTDAMLISELVSNAVEHGNLGITYDEKTGYVANGALHAEVERRLSMPEYASRQVRMRFERHADRLTVLIEDQGKGFEYQKYLEFDEARVFHNHGRGIAMTRSCLNLQYLERGNKVQVTIPLQ